MVYSSLLYEDKMEMFSSFWQMHNLTNNNGEVGEKDNIDHGY